MSTYQHTFQRHKTREVRVGDTVVGDNPIWVQSMTTPDTNLVEERSPKSSVWKRPAAKIVRVTVPKPEDAAVLGEIRRRIHVPLICDIHFDYKMARLPSTTPSTRFASTPATSAATTVTARSSASARTRASPVDRRQRRQPGSEMAMELRLPVPAGHGGQRLRYIEIAEEEGYHDIIVSLKSSDVIMAVEAYRLYA